MDRSTYDNLVNVLFILFAVPCVALTIFWFVFVAARLVTYYRTYKKLISNPYHGNPDLFSYKIKIVMYTLFLLLVLSEFACVLSHSTGIVLFYFLIGVKLPLYRFDDCAFPMYDLWQVEFSNLRIAFCIALRDSAICVNLILLIGLLKFIFLAYQRKTNFTSVKIFLIVFLSFTPILLAISIFPQTMILSNLVISVFLVILLTLVHRHKKQYYLILKWRCDDLRNEGDTNGYIHHTKIRKNSIITFNLFLLAMTIIITFLVLNKLSSVCVMLLTNESKFLTAAYNSDTNLAFLNCKYQLFFYAIKYILDLIEPTATLIALILYSIPMVGVSIGFIMLALYGKCKKIDPKYIRFEGNAK